MSSNISGIDKIYCVNLDRRPDRWEKMMKQFTHHNINVERFSAVDGANISGINPYWSSVIGFNTSQIKVLQLAAEEKHDTVMILEDDAQLHPNFVGLVEEGLRYLPQDWTMCYLGGSNMQEPRKLSGNISVCSETLATTGYIVKVDFAKNRLIPAMLLEYQHKEVDSIFRDIQKQTSIHIFSPRIVYQFEDFSDIQKTNVNYSHQRDF